MLLKETANVASPDGRRKSLFRSCSVEMKARILSATGALVQTDLLERFASNLGWKLLVLDNSSTAQAPEANAEYLVAVLDRGQLDRLHDGELFVFTHCPTSPRRIASLTNFDVTPALRAALNFLSGSRHAFQTDLSFASLRCLSSLFFFCIR
jgi:hypothetical protein